MVLTKTAYALLKSKKGEVNLNIIDLTQMISPDMPVYPGTEPPDFDHVCTIEGNGFREIKMSLYTHTGTHVDTPAHIFTDGASLDELAAKDFVGKAIVINCSYLKQNEKIPCDLIKEIKMGDYEFLLFYTGWSKKWGSEEYFEDFPTLSDELVKVLIDLKLKGIGIDAISIEPVSSEDLKIHKKVLKENMIIIENLTNLDKVIGDAFHLYCLPLKIEKGDGSPVRAIAVK